MTVLREQITTRLPIEEAFDFVADFANSTHWDPGVSASQRLDDGPVGVGARYRLDVRMGSGAAPMEYRITTFERPGRVVLVGRGSRVAAVDDIRFTATPDGTRIDYVADIRLRGLLRLAEPFTRKAMARIGRDAREGMQRALEERAAGHGAAGHGAAGHGAALAAAEAAGAIR
jgi:carbon monoxide dehydrogenase subunit G